MTYQKCEFCKGKGKTEIGICIWCNGTGLEKVE